MASSNWKQRTRHVTVILCLFGLFSALFRLSRLSLESAIGSGSSVLVSHDKTSQALRLQIKQLQEELDRLKTSSHSQPIAEEGKPRDVTVNSMCRCSSSNLAVPYDLNNDNYQTPAALSILQEASKATGPQDKVFHMNPRGCDCKAGGSGTPDHYLKNMERQFCGSPPDSNLTWNALPDFGVEQGLPLFLGVLSYKSPLSLNATLTQWTNSFFTEKSVGLAGSFVQLNKRTPVDDQIINQHRTAFNFTVTGDSEENIHPGRTIARFCRAAEKSPQGHPNGENLMLFLEKDWHLVGHGQDLKELFRAANTLTQRGVNYVRMQPKLTPPGSFSWKCDAEGIQFDCVTAHQQRYTNLPAIIRCDWFLRYMEPFALIDDSIMHGCRNGFRQRKYLDWEECMQDGRVAWTEAQWVVANIVNEIPRWAHYEVDQ